MSHPHGHSHSHAHAHVNGHGHEHAPGTATIKNPTTSITHNEKEVEKESEIDMDAQHKVLEQDQLHMNEIHPPNISQWKAPPHISSMEEYQRMYKESIENPQEFWAEMANKYLTFFQPFTQTMSGTLEKGDVAWFLNGKLNACYNCVDRHLSTRGDKTAIIWESDDGSVVRQLTYKELFEKICQLANALTREGVRKGDHVLIYMPMLPEACIAMLACARIGAAHNVVFAGFSYESVRERIEEGHCRYILTADEGRRGGKTIALKTVIDKAIESLEKPSFIKRVIIYKHTGADIPITEHRDLWWDDIISKQRPYAPCASMDSEDLLFMLFTSGSTGKPKGIVHTHAGFLLYGMLTTRFVFDLTREDDVYFSSSDLGWITGHVYLLYGPLLNGATTVVFESTPTYPNPSRFWATIERHHITHFYTAPTAVRALMKFGPEHVRKHDRSTLRIIGSVGEPINPEAWRWLYDIVGEKRCTIVDTYWQTETGGHVLCPLPGCTPTKPGSATLPFFGIQPVILSPEGKLLAENNASGVLCITKPWPGMARTCLGDHQRYLTTYMKTYRPYYFTGDGCMRDADGYYWITGRVDDVINVSGHRIGSAEIESALITHQSVAESAVIGIPHDVKGQSLFCYVIPIADFAIENEAQVRILAQELQQLVRTTIGAFARPDEILITPNLPKTRSGKIMRRLLRKIACNEINSLGDISTLAEEAVIPRLIEDVAKMRSLKPYTVVSP